MNVGDWVRKRALISPDNVAMIYADGDRELHLTYRELNERVNRAAHYLLDKGVTKGDRVAVLLLNGNEFLELYFAAAKIGAIFVPLNWRLAPPELEHQLVDSGSTVLAFHDAFSEAIEAIRSRIPVKSGMFCTVGEQAPSWADRYDAETGALPTTEPEVRDPADWEDPHMIMYTSGVTGVPKGVLMSHKKIYFNTMNADIYYESLGPQDVYLSPLPLFHSAGLLIVAVPTLYKGATYVTTKTFDPTLSLELIQKHRATAFLALTTVVNFMLSSGKMDEYDLSSLRYFGTGGEKTPLSLFEKLAEKGFQVGQGFGLTENSVLLILPSQDSVRKRGSIGLPVFHCEVKLVNDRGTEVPRGEIGEIVVKGPTVMTGYWNKPEETAAAIRDGWLYTGDLGRQDDEGYFYVVDRKKDMYRSGGENVYPAEVEKVLYDHPQIVEAAIIGVPDEKWGETGKAFVAVQPGETLTKEDVIRFLEGQVARYKFPSHVEFVEALPHTASGKVQKSALQR
jgi:fatty-acyl-CoA synthase